MLRIKAYPNLSTIPEVMHVIEVVNPAVTAPGIIQDAVDLGIKSPIIISAGFYDTGPERVELERQIM